MTDALESDLPAAININDRGRRERQVSAVMIGVDPHKGSHTAVAIDEREIGLATVRVRATGMQTEQLVLWARQWPDRAWAIEGAGGLGHLLAQQLVAAGERVLDVQPKLAARVRLLNTGQVNKNDPNDARSVAAAALRSNSLPRVGAADQSAVMKIWVRRRREVSRSRKSDREPAARRAVRPSAWRFRS